jgi:hypothetical protein
MIVEPKEEETLLKENENKYKLKTEANHEKILENSSFERQTEENQGNREEAIDFDENCNSNINEFKKISIKNNAGTAQNIHEETEPEGSYKPDEAYSDIPMKELKNHGSEATNQESIPSRESIS